MFILGICMCDCVGDCDGEGDGDGVSECVGEQKISDPTQLEVYKMAHELTMGIYKLTARCPKE